jgi:hypothetical protein
MIRNWIEHHLLAILAANGLWQALLTYSHVDTVRAAPAEQRGCPTVIVEVFGDAAYDACFVSWRESEWRAGATGSLGERGYFQIAPIHFDSTYDPYGNAVAAYRLSKGGRDWCTHWRWTCP